jgi:hypothetical protein
MVGVLEGVEVSDGEKVGVTVNTIGDGNRRTVASGVLVILSSWTMVGTFGDEHPPTNKMIRIATKEL